MSTVPEPSIIASERAQNLMEIAATAPQSLKSAVAEIVDPESEIGLLVGALAAQAAALVHLLTKTTGRSTDDLLVLLRQTLSLAQLDPDRPGEADPP